VREPRVIGFSQGPFGGQQPPMLMVDVNGVGYEWKPDVDPSMGAGRGRTRRVVNPLVSARMRHILYAFGTTASGGCFAVVKVSGVWPEIALAHPVRGSV